MTFTHTGVCGNEPSRDNGDCEVALLFSPGTTVISFGPGFVVISESGSGKIVFRRNECMFHTNP